MYEGHDHVHDDSIYYSYKYLVLLLDIHLSISSLLFKSPCTPRASRFDLAGL